MSQFMNILCRSTDALELTEVVTFIQDSWYGDEELSFQPQAESGAANGGPWHVIEFVVPGTERPVRIERDTDPATVGELVGETLEELGPEVPATIAAQLNETRQAVGVELHPEEFTADTWELLDLVLALFARRLDGLVVDDEAVYDKELQRLMSR